jgi:NAD+ synthase
MRFHKNILKIESVHEVSRICTFIQNQMKLMKREGVVIGLSGGIDSALSAALSVKAVGTDKVLGVILPEKESDPDSRKKAIKQAEELGIETKTVDITSVLESFGSYEKRDDIIKQIFPEYTRDYRSKITLPSDILSKDAYNFFTLTIQDELGQKKSARLNNTAIHGITAATDTKQRTRMTYLYFFAESMNYMVCGTTNKSEVIQGYFVKYGDGGVDIEPLAHLYKTQVYQLSHHIGVIKEILESTPSPDTFSAQVSDEEFYFRIPYESLDLLLYAWENNIENSELCKVMELENEQVNRVLRDIISKYKATRHLRELPPSLDKSYIQE